MTKYNFIQFTEESRPIVEAALRDRGLIIDQRQSYSDFKARLKGKSVRLWIGDWLALPDNQGKPVVLPDAFYKHYLQPFNG